MGRIGEAIRSVLANIAKFLRIIPSDERRVEFMDRKLAVAKAKNVDRLDALKHTIKQIEAEVLLKKKEYESARGDSKRIAGGEIERLFRDLDGLRGQERVIFSNIERISVAQAKLAEYKDAQQKGLEEGELDDIAVGLEDAFEGLKTADRASRDLDRIQYESRESKSIESEKRMAEVAGERETTTGLSPETEKRLKQLDTEEA